MNRHKTCAHIIKLQHIFFSIDLNIMDWSPHDVLAIALDNSLYTYTVGENRENKLVELFDDTITSVAWSKNGNYLAMGTNDGNIQVYDCNLRRICNLIVNRRLSRVGALDWNGNVLSCGHR